MSTSIITFANLGEKKNNRTAGIVPVIEAFAKEEELVQVICQINKNYWFANTVSATPTLVRWCIRVVEELTRIPLRGIHLKALDFFAQFKLAPADLFIFHTGESLSRTIKKVKQKGGISISLATISDPVKNKEIEEEEMRLLGIEGFETESADAVRRCPHYNAFDYVIAYSEFVRQTYIEKGYPADRIFTAYSDTPLPEKVTHDWNGKFMVLYVAFTSPRKGLHYLLDAWKELNLPNAELVLVGKYNRTPPELRARYEEIIEKDPSITWVGRVKDPTPYYRDASVFVLPSLIEGNPYVVMEAMGHSLPVITTPHAQSLVEDEKSGYVVPIRDADAIREKITHLYHNRDLAERLGAAGRRTMEHKKEYGAAVYEICQEILAREGSLQ